MDTIFKGKIRRIGTSLGVLIPKQLIKDEKIKEGEEVEIALLKRKKHLIAKAFGVTKGSKPFVRDMMNTA
ncbi:MAG: AbrB/MazE/SpoVT family DNA-binding domain-containing protein [Candidatus Micrarchaeota archaeon]|nr:AbrB/MazE/SpoVT family DNA-binding domain-containing protein [Candidatus Micrarchaeota archaeon]